MSEEIKNNSTEQAVATTPTEPGKPFKVYNSEDEFKKEAQSIASKAKYEVLKDLNVKNLDEVRAVFTEAEALKAELASTSKIKEEYEAIKTEKQKLSENLLMTQLGVKQELRDDFLVLAKSKTSDKVQLEDAAKNILEKYTYFKGTDDVAAQVANKIGTEKKTPNVDLKDEERQRLMKKYPHLRNKI
jgi:hypothetical protein